MNLNIPLSIKKPIEGRRIEKFCEIKSRFKVNNYPREIKELVTEKRHAQL